MTILTEEFLQGARAGAQPGPIGDCFGLNNPFIPASSAHMAFEAGRFAAQHWPVGELKSARQSRGYSIRFKVGVNEEHVVVVDYDRRQVYRK